MLRLVRTQSVLCFEIGNALSLKGTARPCLADFLVSREARKSSDCDAGNWLGMQSHGCCQTRISRFSRNEKFPAQGMPKGVPARSLLVTRFLVGQGTGLP